MDRKQRTREVEEHDYIHIVAMSQEFAALDPEKFSGQTAEYWKVKTLLAIAQQLSVIATVMKKEDRD